VVPVVLGVTIPIVLIGGLVFLLFVMPVLDPPPPNARCPDCLSTFHIADLDKKTLTQKAAIKRRCPVCGNYNDLWTYETVFQVMPPKR
jgi:hypothetical protein